MQNKSYNLAFEPAFFRFRSPHFLHYTTISVSESKWDHIGLQPLV